MVTQAEAPSKGAAHAGAPASAYAHAFRPDIQGLRAIAVLSVVLYHANSSLIGGGFAGVDIFFVISGYLIAGILMGELERGQFSLLGFYERRVRRLFPALFLMLASATIAGALLLPPAGYDAFAHDAFATIFFASNIQYFLHSGYFDAEAHFNPLLHTWSLAVEEQFYLLFPLLLAALFAHARARIRLMLAGLALISLIACEAVVREHASAAFYLAPFRAFELLMGAAIAHATFAAALPQRARDAISLIGLALIGVGLFTLNDESRFPGIAALAPCAGTALVLVAGAGGESAGGRLIANPVFGFFGATSYSLYLWHWPLLVFARYALLRAPNAIETAALIMLAIGAAAASWYFVERRFLKRRGRPWRAVGAGIAAMAAGAAAMFVVGRLDGLPQRFDARSLELFAAAEDFSPKRQVCHNGLLALSAYANMCSLGAEGATPRWALWADSHGTELAYALGERLAARGEALLQLTASACPPSLDVSTARRPLCAAQNRLMLGGLTQDARIDTVVFAANFMGYTARERTRFIAHFSAAVESVARAGKRVILVYPIPIFSLDPPTALGLVARRGGDVAAFGLTRAEYDFATRDARIMLDALAARTGAASVHPEALLCDAERCHAYDPAHGALYFNHNHLSLTGARWLARRFELEPAL